MMGKVTETRGLQNHVSTVLTIMLFITENSNECMGKVEPICTPFLANSKGRPGVTISRTGQALNGSCHTVPLHPRTEGRWGKEEEGEEGEGAGHEGSCLSSQHLAGKDRRIAASSRSAWTAVQDQQDYIVKPCLTKRWGGEGKKEGKRRRWGRGGGEGKRSRERERGENRQESKQRGH